MSYVNVLIIRDDCVYLTSIHYRKAMKLLENGLEEILPLLQHRFLDAGYIVLDLNKKTIINAQNAFSVTKVTNKRNLYVIEA